VDPEDNFKQYQVLAFERLWQFPGDLTTWLDGNQVDRNSKLTGKPNNDSPTAKQLKQTLQV
jgi:hypothetical protein